MLRCAPTDAIGVMAMKPTSFVQSFVLVSSACTAAYLDNVFAAAASEAGGQICACPMSQTYTSHAQGRARRGESIGREGFYILGAGVPSDHLSTPTKNTAMGGKLWSCGYDCSDKYQ